MHFLSLAKCFFSPATTAFFVVRSIFLIVQEIENHTENTPTKPLLPQYTALLFLTNEKLI
jgi:hypothetical protein